ncbi:MAG: hypothetical protein LBQ22_03245 [Bacteroidales bacterium]|jgi:hypothetical protein|nr:hypothetical protein [Bacteroidales bacterium]
MNQLIKNSFISFFVFAVFACSSPRQKNFSHIEEYFENTHNYKFNDTINKIVVIAEGSVCGSCENAFAKTTYQYLKNDKTIFLITTMGTIIDINPFLQMDNNCFFDWQLNTSEFPEFESSRVIYLENSQIDTIVILDSSILSQQLEYIKNKH